MKPIVVDETLVAHCGLYCGACRAYRKGKCPGCAENTKATWCSIRTCCHEHHYDTCADCQEFRDPNDCKKFNNFISKIFGFVFRSDRRACVLRIRECGRAQFAKEMSEQGRHSIKRK